MRMRLLDDMSISLDDTELMFKMGKINKLYDIANKKLTYATMTEYMLMLLRVAYDSSDIIDFCDKVSIRIPDSVISIEILSYSMVKENQDVVIAVHLFRGKVSKIEISDIDNDIIIKNVAQFIYKLICDKTNADYKFIYRVYNRIVSKLSSTNILTITNAMSYTMGYDDIYSYVLRAISSSQGIYIIFEPTRDASSNVKQSIILGVLDAIRDSNHLSSFKYSRYVCDAVINSTAFVKLICGSGSIQKVSKGYTELHLKAS